MKELARKYQQENPNNRARNRRWGKLNKPKKAFYQRRRNAKKKGATPSWLTAIHRAQIQEFYDIAAALTMQTGIRHEVDHIHPLQHDVLCGLHVPWNLQILTRQENISKKNRLVDATSS